MSHDTTKSAADNDVWRETEITFRRHNVQRHSDADVCEAMKTSDGHSRWHTFRRHNVQVTLMSMKPCKPLMVIHGGTKCIIYTM